MKNLQREALAIEWDSLYLRDQVPWRSRGLSRATYRLLRTYSAGTTLLELGCGYGDDAGAISNMGFDYTGIDLSGAAIHGAKSLHILESSGRFMQADFFRFSRPQAYDVVYDKGFFHGLAGVRRRNAFLHRVAGFLRPNGIWVTVCGSADHRRTDFPHGAIYLRDLIGPAEVFFEVLAVTKSAYYLADRKHDFCSWHAAFRRR